MKNILFYCNTHSQIIIALQIAKCFFRDDNVNYIISDHSNNSKIYAENLKKIIGNDKVFFVKSKKNDFVDAKFLKIPQLILNKFPLAILPLQYYHEFITYNYFPSIALLVKHLRSFNPNIKISRMEEGIMSYNSTIRNKQLNNNLKDKIKNYILDIVGWYDLFKYEKNIYCTYPQLYNGNLNCIPIPLIDLNDIDFTNKIRNIFLIDKSKLNYPQKYIYFPSVYDFEGGEPIGELELIKKIAAYVGRDNVLVKVHPRDDINRFINAGLNVDKNSSIPWEAIQLNYDFSNHVFLTTCSGSVLSISPIVHNPPKTFFLYNLFKSSNKLLKETVEKFLPLKVKFDKSDIFDYIKIANNFSDIFVV